MASECQDVKEKNEDDDKITGFAQKLCRIISNILKAKLHYRQGATRISTDYREERNQMLRVFQIQVPFKLNSNKYLPKVYFVSH